MTWSPLLKMVLTFLSQSGKSSSTFAKNSVKRFLSLNSSSERMVLEYELVVKLIYDFNEVPLSPGRQSGLQNPIRARRFNRSIVENGTLCVHCYLLFLLFFGSFVQLLKV